MGGGHGLHAIQAHITSPLGCTIIDSLYVRVGDITLIYDSLAQISCTNSSGYIAVHATGGFGPYSYSWNTTPVSTDSTLSIPHPGIYEVSVTDALGCTAQASNVMTGPNIPGIDMHALLTSSGTVRRNRAFTLFLDAFNTGCTPASCSLKLILDPRVTLSLASMPAPNIISGDTLIWHFSSLAFGTPHLMPQVIVIPNSGVSVGDMLCFMVSICPFTGDVNGENNSAQHCRVVAAPYDPNYKVVVPEQCMDYVLNEQVLSYTVHFQNVGTVPAIDVFINDTLDADLDLTTFNVVSKSHDPMLTSLIGPNTVQFKWNNINLPDSGSNMAGSSGYVVFEAMPKPVLANGTEITNDVGIFFDFNAPVLTNTVRSVVVDAIPEIQATVVDTALGPYTFNGQTYTASGTYSQVFQTPEGCDSTVILELTIATAIEDKAKPLALNIYPNPTKGSLTVELGKVAARMEVQVQDLTGKTATKVSANGTSKLTLDMKDQPAGLYFVHVQADAEKKVVKIVKTE